MAKPEVIGEGPCPCQDCRGTAYGEPQHCDLCNDTGVLPILAPALTKEESP